MRPSERRNPRTIDRKIHDRPSATRLFLENAQWERQPDARVTDRSVETKQGNTNAPRPWASLRIRH